MKVVIEEEFYILNCPSCGLRFAILKRFRDLRAEDKADWYCPNGHVMSYRESEADRLRRERDRLAQQIAQRDDEIRHQREMREQAERSAVALRGQITKLNKRVSSGVCPCCTRSFQNLRRHIATKHPEYGAENVVQFKAESA